MLWHAFFMKTRGRVSFTLILALSTRGRIHMLCGESYAHLGRFCWKLVCICEMLHVRRKIEKKRLHLLRGSLHMCRGSSFGFPEFCALWCALCELCFVSAVSSYCPCLRGPRLGLASDLVFACSVALDHLLEVCVRGCFLFLFLYDGYYGCCQCTHQGGDWGQGVSEDQWRVAP